MVEPTYRCRTSLWSGEVTWTLTDDAIESTAGTRLPFAKMAAIRLFTPPSLWAYGGLVTPPEQQCRITPRHGRTIVLTSSHFLRPGRFENRKASFAPFVEALLRRVAVANPATLRLAGMPRAVWWVWNAILLLCVLVSGFALAVIVAALRTGGASGDALVALPALVGGVALSVSIAVLLRRARTRALDPR